MRYALVVARGPSWFHVRCPDCGKKHEHGWDGGPDFGSRSADCGGDTYLCTDKADLAGKEVDKDKLPFASWPVESIKARIAEVKEALDE